jgi:hypothetical protein
MKEHVELVRQLSYRWLAREATVLISSQQFLEHRLRTVHVGHDVRSGQTRSFVGDDVGCESAALEKTIEGSFVHDAQRQSLASSQSTNCRHEQLSALLPEEDADEIRKDVPNGVPGG